MNRIRKWSGRILLILLAPPCVFIMAEALLWISGYSPSLTLLQKVTFHDRDYWATNPGYGRLLFSRESAPIPSHVWIPVDKAPDVKRVVVLGESAAAGFPTEDFNMARVLEAVWNRSHPEWKIEAVNLTMTGINSHVLRRFMKEALQVEPDMVVVYAGHNEAIGPYGPASVFGGRMIGRFFPGLSLAMRHTRVGWLLREVVEQMPAFHKTPVHKSWSGLDEFLDKPLPWSDPSLVVMERRFRANISAIVASANRENVPIIIAVPAVNITDWPPLNSEPNVLTDAEVYEAWRAGRWGALTSAWQVYELARRIADESMDLAWPIFRKARDLDLYRFRADSRIQQVILDIADEYRGKPVLGIDTDAALHESNAAFLNDREYFFEHVHLTFEGMVFICSHLARGMATIWGIDELEQFTKIDIYEVADHLFFTEIDRYAGLQRVLEFMRMGVFADQPEGDRRQSEFKQMMLDLRDGIKSDWNMARLTRELEAHQLSGEPDSSRMFIAGRLALFLGGHDVARDLFNLALKHHPRHLGAWVNLFEVHMLLDELLQAEQTLLKLKEIHPDPTRLDARHGELCARMGRYPEAINYLSAALNRNPRDYATMVNLGGLFMSAGFDSKAIDIFERCLIIHPEDAYVMNNLAWLLLHMKKAEAKDIQKAVFLAERAVSLDPVSHRYQGTLAIAYASSGRVQEARILAMQAIDLAKQVGDYSAITLLENRLWLNKVE
ncbi:MAG TPA: tetratricopeptide repeat protein [Kiritimatiellia bacterium]|nr:tetratricopeptide repeat protein [Kiritimatiellia bacterium]